MNIDEWRQQASASRTVIFDGDPEALPVTGRYLVDIAMDGDVIAVTTIKRKYLKVGRAPQIPEAIVQRIIQERDNGLTLQAIADGLNFDKVPTAQKSGRWHTSTIHNVCQRHRQADAIADLRDQQDEEQLNA